MKRLLKMRIYKIMFATIAGLCLMAGMVPGSFAASTGLTDISNHWAKDDIEKLVALGSINGYPDGTFKPDNNITRAEFTKVLITSLGEDPEDGNVFMDTGNHWSEGYIKAALKQGIIELPDYYNNRFGPDVNITRGEIAKMVVRGMSLKDEAGGMGTEDMEFKDRDNIPNKFAGYVAAATKQQIINGYPDGTFRSDGEATRAEAATMVVRMLDWLENNDSENNTGEDNGSNNDSNIGTGGEIDLDNIVESPLGDDGKRYGSNLKVIDKPFMIEILQGKLWHNGDTDENGNVINIVYDYGYNIRAKYLMLEFKVTNITKETRDFRPIFWVWQTYGVETPVGEPGKVYTQSPFPLGNTYIKPGEELRSTTLKSGESVTGKYVFKFDAEQVTSAIFHSHLTIPGDERFSNFIPLPEEWWKD